MNFKKLKMNLKKCYVNFTSSSKDKVNKPQKLKVLRKW